MNSSPILYLSDDVALRPAVDADNAFRFALFADRLAEEWVSAGICSLPAPLARLQFEARERARCERFPDTLPTVVSHDGIPVGEVMAALEAGCLRIADFLIEPAYRNRGIGGVVMHALQTQAARRGVPLRLSVAAINVRARRFYERHGFTTAGETSGGLDIEMSWQAPGGVDRACSSPVSCLTRPRLGGWLWVGVLFLLFLSIRPASAQFVESEPNNDKTNADLFTLSPGSTVRGNTQDVAAAGQGDYFRLGFNNPTPGFYSNTLTITSTLNQSGFTGSIRGLTQSAGVVTPGTDTIIQNVTQNASGTASNLFYTAGSSSSLYYRVTGNATTTADYFVTYQRQLITPTNIGSFASGSITFTSVGYAFTPTSTQADTSFAVFDSNFNLIGEDSANVYLNDNSLSGSPGSTLTRNYTPGTYYLAVTYGHLSSASSAASDDSGATGLSSPVLDFTDVLSNNNTFTNRDISFRAYNGSAYVAPGNPAPYADRLVDAMRTNALEVNFYRFTVVVPEPGAGALWLFGAGIGFAAAGRRRLHRALMRRR
jgi:GNAT superfamily N-acetyltransferase